MPKKRQALIEFNEITSAITCVNDASRSVTLIAGQPAYMNYSNNQKLIRMGLVSIFIYLQKWQINIPHLFKAPRRSLCVCF